jgi:hypothetical protein
MEIEELLKQDKIETSFQEFHSFLYDQKINPVFKSFAYLPINFKKAKEHVKLYQIDHNGFYFILEFDKQPILIYNINILNNEIKNAYCLNRELLKNMISFFSSIIDMLEIPLTTKNSRVTNEKKE